MNEKCRLILSGRISGKSFCVLLALIALLLNACGSDDDGDTDIDGDAEVKFEDEAELDGDAENSNEIDRESEIFIEEYEEELSEISESDGDREFIIEEEAEPEADQETGPMKCNGFAGLCDKRYNEIAYVTTHNSMSNSDDEWIAPNQIHNIETQLTDGVRGFMLDTYAWEGTTWLCHGDCTFGKKPLAEALAEMKTFIDDNPHEVLTIIFESYITPAETETAFTESGLIDYIYTPATNQTEWPTLEEMINSDSKMVVYTDPWDSSAMDWHLDEWQYCWETPWHVTELEGFDCSVNRGSQDNGVFILNHFLYGAFDMPSQELSAQANANPFLFERASGCLAETGKMPNFITVNHYSVGDVFEAINQLNGVE